MGTRQVGCNNDRRLLVSLAAYINRLNGEIAERQFCDEHLLSLPTLGMAAEAKVRYQPAMVNVTCDPCSNN